jgi:hypothetical protein
MLQRSPARSVLPVLLLTSLAVIRPSGQAPPQQPAERGADLLSLQFAVVAGDGTPVADLQAADVKVRIGGRERAVRSLQLVSLSGSSLAGAAMMELPPPFGTNASSKAGRTLVLALDEDSLRPGREAPLRAATDQLIAGLGSSDRVTMLSLPFGTIKVPLTSDRSRLRLAMSQTVGQASSNESGSEMACRTRRTLEALAGFLESLGVREEPMTVMMVTAALAAPRRDAVSALAPGMCELSETLFNRVATAAGAARAGFYLIRPDDASERASNVQVQSNIGSDNPLAGIEHLAGVTEGKLMALSASSGSAFGRVLRETSAYYVATVDTEKNDRNGRPQQLDIRVARKDVELRSQPRIAFAADPANGKVAQPSVRDMLTTLRVFRDLPLRAAGFPALTSEGPNIRVMTVAEAIEPDVKLASMGAALFTAEGKLTAQWVATPEELQRTPVVGAMSAPAGGYRLRVAAIDSSGRSGAADYEVTAEILQSGPLKLSSLVLGLSRAGGFSPRLQFTTEPLAIAYVELEGAPAGARLSAGLEVSQSMNGPALVTVPLTIGSASNNRYSATGSVPLGALPAGDYVVRAMIGLEGHPMTRVVRTIRKATPAAR